MTRIAVESSLITSIGWTPVTPNIGTLEVEFPARGGNTVPPVYEYYEVPKTVWEEFQAAESIGKYFLANIKQHYGFKRVEADKESAE
jgi:hypothetical protein